MDNIKIVVLDSMLDITHPIFKNKEITVYNWKNDFWQIKNDRDKISTNFPHGTAVCGIICKNTISCEIINFDIFGNNLFINKNILISALEYIEKYIQCDLINMSIGIRKDDSILYSVCKRLNDKGVIIISAFDNSGSVSYPAAYPFVIGVDTSYRCIHVKDFVYVENSIVNIRAKGGNQKVPWNNGGYVINQGSSFAAPYVTSYFAELLQKELKKEEILIEIKNHSKFVYKSEKKAVLDNNISIKKAAVIPFNKEVHSLLNYVNLLPFELVSIYDTKYSGNVGLTIKSIDCLNSYKIKNIESCSWNEIDTLIIGHLSEIEFYSGRNIKEKLFEECLLHNKNVFCFDNNLVSRYRLKFLDKKLQLYYPTEEINNILANKFGKMYQIKAPVIGVFGTSKSQGKFTLQLLLRQLFTSKGYHVGQLGTEPSSKLFGIDEVFPFGYDGIKDIDINNFIEYLNILMNEIDKKNPDIIIAGSQSGTIPRYTYNIGQLTMEQLAFLLGINPDAVILCVNIDDEIDYIKRTITVIENLGECKVLCLVVYPFSYNNGWGIINDKKVKVNEEILYKKKEEFKDIFHLPVVSLERTDEIFLFNVLIDFFKGV